MDIIKRRHKDGWWEIDWTADSSELQERFGPHANLRSIQAMQVMVFTMCGGGWIGRSAVECPADFYIDSRTGKLPYPNRQIIQAVKCLAFCCELAGYSTGCGKAGEPMPLMPKFDNLGIF